MRSALGRCLDPRVLAALAGAGVVVWIAAPSAIERERQRIADEIARTQTQVAAQRRATALGTHPERGDAA